jgi:Gpi18-like mannosyltransferase
MTSRHADPKRLLWLLDTPVGLTAMFAVGLIVRVALAPHLSFYGDVHLFQGWTKTLSQVGTHKFYAQAGFADYPPGYLYVLWLTGKISATPSFLLLKLPAIAADLGLAWIVGTLAERLAPDSLRQRLPVRALVAGFAVLFNPAIIALSAVWGQVDAVPAMLVLWALLLLYTGPQSLRREIAALLIFAMAITMKPQEGFVLPVMLYALYRRYLHRQALSAALDGALSIAISSALSLGLWAVSGLAFGLGPAGLVHFYSKSASVYPYTSANAFNLWGVVGFWRPDKALVPGNGTAVWKLAGIPALYLGWLLFIAGTVLVLWQAHRAIERGAHEARTYMVASTAVSLLSYVVLTRMHERYMFLSLACLAPLIFVRYMRWSFVALSLLYVLNLWWVFAYFNLGWGVQAFHYQPVFDWLFGGLGTDSWQRKVLSLAVTATGLTVVALGVRWVASNGLGPVAVPLVADEPPWDADLPTDAEDEVEPAPARSWSKYAAFFRADRDAAGAALTSGRWARWGPYSLVGVVCAFGLWVLHSETRPAANLNDSAFHLQMVRWASGQIHEGRIPLDGWFPDLTLGSSFFHHYQSLAETLTAYTALVTGVSDQTAYLWFLYLLLALWPLSIYWSARLLGWARWTAAAAAAVSPLLVSAPGYGYEHGSYTWQGYGVYSQEWAMWLLPLAWGFTWRAVARGKRYPAAAAALALTMATHFITGYLAMLTVGMWVIVGGAGLVRRAGRGTIVAVGAVLIASWVLVPLVADTKWTTRSEYYQGSIFNNSYGAQKELGWLISGKLFDAGRFPIVTLLFLGGVAVCGLRVRHDPRARALLGIFTLSMLLFFGRHGAFGHVLMLLPGMGDIQIHRFVMGVDLATILIAGVGLAWVLRQTSVLLVRLTPRHAPALAALASVLIAIGVLAPAWTGRASYDRRDAVLIRGQQFSDATDGRDLDKLVAIIKARGDGRVYAGLRSNWGHDYAIGQVPVYAYLSDKDVDAVGFTFRTLSSLSNDVEAAFDEANPAQYQMLGVRYLLLPAGQKPTVQAKLIASSGRHRLYEVANTGYFQVVDGEAPIAANRTNLEQQTRAWRKTNLASRAIYPSIAFAGAAGAPATFSGPTPPSGSPGSVLRESQRLQDGAFDATIQATRPAVVILKATFDPRWNVTVDGVAAKPVMMAPSIVGVDVPAGRHQIAFRYKSYGRYPYLFALGALALLALVALGRGWLLPTRSKDRRPEDRYES